MGYEKKKFKKVTGFDAGFGARIFDDRMQQWRG